MEVNSSSKTNSNFLTNSAQNNKTEKDTIFSTLLLQDIEIMGQLPANAMDQMRKESEESFSDEKYEELLEKFDLQNLSDDEKELYKSIISDRYVSNEEMENLSYEQMKVLHKFKTQKDENGEYIKESSIYMEYKAQRMFDTAFVSKDDDFNKAIYETVKNMDNDEKINSYMAFVTGSWNFPCVKSMFYDSDNPAELLTELIAKNQRRLDTSLLPEEIEFYKTLGNVYSNILSKYDEVSGKDIKEGVVQDDYSVDIKAELIADFLSMLKTGLTQSEIEELEEMIQHINRLIDDSNEKEVSEEKIQKMIQRLQDEISKIQKRLGGEEEVKTDQDLEVSDSEDLTNSMKVLKSIVLSLEKALEEIAEDARLNGLSQMPSLTSTQEEFALKEELKNNL